MEIRFFADQAVRDGAGRVRTSFAAGRVYDLPPASARRWLRRRLAELVPPQAAAAPPARGRVDSIDGGSTPPEGAAASHPTPAGGAAAPPSSPARGRASTRTRPRRSKTRAVDAETFG